MLLRLVSGVVTQLAETKELLERLLALMMLFNKKVGFYFSVHMSFNASLFLLRGKNFIRYDQNNDVI